ncbi:hypothetical protein PQS31_09790 [Luteimonas sp BLCC-B24]|uniref:hypothetical protein n=1 Tax=Luteimonas sp. BLCC-B24 TaxID=3025317 RepID=UPI00234CD4EC|nr:hypothetical protein [Luteimonas sp. BLCC-B24]MDC7807111.1 hypothetical protein [Luteimonas sp. BLCC-B24]
MPFTPAQLATQMAHPQLATWASSSPQNQGPYLQPYIAYFNGIQAWIDVHGGNGAPFGYDNVAGMEVNGVQVQLLGPQQKAPFNDAFNDVRAHLGQQGFRLFQAAEASQRLIGVLNRM